MLDINGASTSPCESLTVITPVQASQQLFNMINGMHLQSSFANSLDLQLQSALNSINAGQDNTAKNQLHWFINHVNAQSGMKLTAD